MATGIKTNMSALDIAANALRTAFGANSAGAGTGACLKFYKSSGTPPATASAAINGTLICTITNNSTSTGLVMTAASGGSGVIIKSNSDTWSGSIGSTNTPDYMRLCNLADDQTVADTGSSSYARAQFSVGTTGCDYNTSQTWTSGLTHTVDNGFFYAAVSVG